MLAAVGCIRLSFYLLLCLPCDLHVLDAELMLGGLQIVGEGLKKSATYANASIKYPVKQLPKTLFNVGIIGGKKKAPQNICPNFS